MVTKWLLHAKWRTEMQWMNVFKLRCINQVFCAYEAFLAKPGHFKRGDGWKEPPVRSKLPWLEIVRN